MLNFTDYHINEGLGYSSPVVFHITSLNRLVNYLQKGQIRLNSGVGSYAETKFNRGKYYFLSTARTPHNAFYTYINNDAAILVLDRNKIKNNKKIVAVDYWENGKRNSELEDRILSNSPNLSTDVIKEIHIFIKNAHVPDNYNNSKNYMFVIYKKFDKKKIWIYTKADDFKNLNKKNAISLKSYMKNISVGVKGRRITPFKNASGDWGDDWLELYYKKDRAKLSKSADSLRYEVTYYPHEMGRKLKDLVQSQSSPVTPRVEKLLKLMRKEGYKEPEKFAEFFTKKWHDENVRYSENRK